jgi:hypothetical protein
MSTSPADNLESLDRAMRLSNLRREIEVKSFYHVALAAEQAFAAREVDRLAEAKRRLIEDVVVVAPLAAHIVRGSSIECSLADDAFACHGPATCFRVHELLRKTRSHPEARIVLNGEPMGRGQLLAHYRMLVPNTNLEPRSRYSPYTLPRILLAGLLGGIIAGARAGRSETPETWLDPRAAAMGAGLVLVIMSLLGQFALSRNILKTAPWNASLYNDVNLLLYRRDPALLYLARREYVERNQFIKGGLNGRRYHERARAIEDGTYVDVLQRNRREWLARSGS